MKNTVKDMIKNRKPGVTVDAHYFSSNLQLLTLKKLKQLKIKEKNSFYPIQNLRSCLQLMIKHHRLMVPQLNLKRMLFQKTQLP